MREWEWNWGVCKSVPHTIRCATALASRGVTQAEKEKDASNCCSTSSILFCIASSYGSRRVQVGMGVRFGAAGIREGIGRPHGSHKHTPRSTHVGMGHPFLPDGQTNTLGILAAYSDPTGAGMQTVSPRLQATALEPKHPVLTLTTPSKPNCRSDRLLRLTHGT